MFAQWERGPALKYYRVPAPNGAADSRAQREEWFRECLAALDSLPMAVPSIAFPSGIGCGLAAGNWINYYGIIAQWAANHPGTAVQVVSLAPWPA